jgi:hypothetical protein
MKRLAGIPFLTEKEFCAAANVSRTTVWRLRKTGTLTPYREGRLLRYSQRQVDQFLPLKNKQNKHLSNSETGQRLVEAVERLEATASQALKALELLVCAQTALACDGMSRGLGLSVRQEIGVALAEITSELLKKQTGGTNQ